MNNQHYKFRQFNGELSKSADLRWYRPQANGSKRLPNGPTIKHKDVFQTSYQSIHLENYQIPKWAITTTQQSFNILHLRLTL